MLCRCTGEWLNGRALAWGARGSGFNSRLPDTAAQLFFTGHRISLRLKIHKELTAVQNADPGPAHSRSDRRRIAILFGHAPSGHVTVAQAIAEELSAQGAEPVLINLSEEFYTTIGPAVSSFYFRVLEKAPWLWEIAYDKSLFVLLAKTAKKIFRRGDSARLWRLVESKNVCAAICTHSTPCFLLAGGRRNGYPPVFGVVTDFSAHSFWPSPNVEHYFVHDGKAAADLTRKGVSPSRISETGIPVRAEFRFQPDKVSARRDLGLPAEKPAVLLCGGSKGMGGLKTAFEEALKFSEKISLIAVCGENAALAHELKSLAGQKNALVLNAEKNVARIMSACDAVIGKPGGVTMAEALSLGIPPVIFMPLPGQELRNTSYLVGKGAALYLKNRKELGAFLERLAGGIMAGPDRGSIGSLSRPEAAKHAASEILARLEEQNGRHSSR